MIYAQTAAECQYIGTSSVHFDITIAESNFLASQVTTYAVYRLLIACH